MLQSAVDEVAARGKGRVAGENELARLVDPVLELILKLRARSISASPDLRRQIDNHLKQVEARGAASGYSAQQLEDARFALAAFADETVLAGGSPMRQEWERYPLQLEYFKEAFAGTKFFDRLDNLLKQPEQQADVIEVYYLCLILGFKGKYHIYLEDQLPGVIENVAQHLRRVGRLRPTALSPHWKVSDQPDAPAAAPEMPRWIKVGLIAAIGIVSLVYVVMKYLLISGVNDMKLHLLK